MKRLSGFVAVALLTTGGVALAEGKIVTAFDIAEACFSDVKSLCEGAMATEGGIKGCVKDNITNVSKPCFDAMMAGFVEAGDADFAGTAKVMRFDDLRGVQYCELNLIYPDLANVALYAEMWNSTGLNNADDPKNTCPDDLWAKVDPETLAATNKVMKVWKNGPRGWTMDWIELPVGEVTTFDGWQGRWMARPNLPKGVNPDEKGSSAYKPLTVERESTMTFKAGQPVFILDDPEGTPWVMQAYGMMVDPTLSYDTLKDLGAKLKPAEGWSFRVAVLDKDLTISAVDGKAKLVQDELQNSYDACFETACTFRP